MKIFILALFLLGNFTFLSACSVIDFLDGKHLDKQRDLRDTPHIGGHSGNNGYGGNNRDGGGSSRGGHSH